MFLCFYSGSGTSAPMNATTEAFLKGLSLGQHMVETGAKNVSRTSLLGQLWIWKPMKDMRCFGRVCTYGCKVV